VGKVGKIFAWMAADLARARGAAGKPRTVLCPICCRSEFLRNALETHELTEEHIIPESLGGKEAVLSCKSCNNTQGSRLESHLSGAIAAEEALGGAGALRSVVNAGAATVRGEVELRLTANGTSVIRVSDKVSNPSEIRRMQRALTAGIRKMELEVNLGYVPARYRIGLLRVGYLALFRLLGYSYTLSPALEPIRRQILEEDPPNEDVQLLSARVPGLDSAMTSPFAAFQPQPESQVQAFLVLAVLRRAHRHTFAVLLPKPDLAPEAVFRNLRYAAKHLSKTGIRVVA